MIRFLIHRPIAVLMTFSVLIVFGVLALKLVPISLLPSIDVPQIVVKLQYPNTPAASVEENIVRPIRENLSTLNGLKDLESISSNHNGILYLTFEYGTRMDLAYIDVNEKLDRVTNSLPKDLPRPQVIRINTSDIPIVNIQVTPRQEADYVQISELTEKIIRKRIEQIEGVSLVDINGMQTGVIQVTPRQDKLHALGLSISSLTKTIQQANQNVGGLSVKDGQYQYFIKVANQLEDADNINRLPVILENGTVIEMNEVARVEFVPESPVGLHFFNGKNGLVVTVHKQSRARMNELVPKIREAIEIFKKDYPEIEFEITQDQSFILEAGIGNLSQAILFGGVFCVALLFLFLGNYASPILMSISIPSSLLISFIFFYLFDLSLNIISLSGLALGLGMLIDNSIVVLDRITRKRRGGLSVEESCEIGVNEVVGPVVSSVLTSVAVYAPLVYLSGLAGALVLDQAIALTISLSVSLLIAFCLNPVLYKVFVRHFPENLREDTRVYAFLNKRYHSLIEWVLRRKFLAGAILIFVLPIGFIISQQIPFTSLPEVKQEEGLLVLDWNEPISVSENADRTKSLMTIVKNDIQQWAADVGVQQYLLQKGNSGAQQMEVYFQCQDEDSKNRVVQKINDWIASRFPQASYTITKAPNAFTQLFENKSPFLEARFKTIANSSDPNEISNVVNNLSTMGWSKGLGLIDEQNIEMMIDNDKLAIYQVSSSDVLSHIERLFGNFRITELKRFGRVSDVQFSASTLAIDIKLKELVPGKSGTMYPLNEFVSYSYGKERKFITADRSGVYHSVLFNEVTTSQEKLMREISEFAHANVLGVTYTGRYFENKQMGKDMFVIFLISITLLYLILAIQFENLIHPLVVILTMPLGIAGAMVALYVSGGSLDVMAAIGFIVVLGIIVDDPILKVETINRLLQKYGYAESLNKKEILFKSIIEAGEICLKPVLLTSLTTMLALIPILFLGGIGSALQRPLVWVVVGGLSIGTFFTLWFVPLAYWLVTKK